MIKCIERYAVPSNTVDRVRVDKDSMIICHVGRLYVAIQQKVRVTGMTPFIEREQHIKKCELMFIVRIFLFGGVLAQIEGSNLYSLNKVTLALVEFNQSDRNSLDMLFPIRFP